MFPAASLSPPAEDIISITAVAVTRENHSSVRSFSLVAVIIFMITDQTRANPGYS